MSIVDRVSKAYSVFKDRFSLKKSQVQDLYTTYRPYNSSPTYVKDKSVVAGIYNTIAVDVSNIRSSRR